MKVDYDDLSHVDYCYCCEQAQDEHRKMLRVLREDLRVVVHLLRDGTLFDRERVIESLCDMASTLDMDQELEDLKDTNVPLHLIRSESIEHIIREWKKNNSAYLSDL